MIVSLVLILLAQLLGEIVARASALPVPGPVLGGAFLLVFLVLRDRGGPALGRFLPEPLSDGSLERTCKVLLAHLSLLFVPAGVGVVGRLDVLAANGLALAVVLLVSVTLTIVATAVTFTLVARWMQPSERSDADPASRE